MIQETIKEVSQDADIYYMDIVSRLNALADKLGIAAEHLWTILVAQAYNEGITLIICPLIVTLCILITFKLGHKKYRNCPATQDEEPYLFWTVGSGILLIMSTIISTIIIKEGILALMNPEYYAWQEIQSILK